MSTDYPQVAAVLRLCGQSPIGYQRTAAAVALDAAAAASEGPPQGWQVAAEEVQDRHGRARRDHRKGWEVEVAG